MDSPIHLLEMVHDKNCCRPTTFNRDNIYVLFVLFILLLEMMLTIFCSFLVFSKANTYYNSDGTEQKFSREYKEKCAIIYHFAWNFVATTHTTLWYTAKFTIKNIKWIFQTAVRLSSFCLFISLWAHTKQRCVVKPKTISDNLIKEQDEQWAFEYEFRWLRVFRVKNAKFKC